MVRRDRQGWRVLIVLSRLAVAGILIASGPLSLTGPKTLPAQTDRTESPPPPPSPPSRPPSHTAGPNQTGPPVGPRTPPTPRADTSDAVQPTPAVSVSSAINAPPKIVLPIELSLEKLTAERNSLNQFLYRDRRHKLLLTRGDQALSGGDVDLALLHYQALVDAASDAFYWPEDSLRPGGVQFTAQLRLRSLPENIRNAYERRHGAEARALFVEAVQKNDRRTVLSLLKRFRLTQAGREAMIRELLIAYDLGQLRRASQFARLLAEDPQHCQQLTPQLKELVRRLADSSIGGQTTELAAATVPLESVSPPSLRPLWTRSLTAGIDDGEASDPASSVGDMDRLVEDAITRWQLEHEDRRLPVTTSNEPLVVDHRVLIRDFTGIRALDLETGRSLWSFRTAGSLAASAQAVVEEEARGEGAPPLSFHADFAGQGPRGRLSTDRHRVFFIDSHERQLPRQAAEEGSASQHASNRIVALNLATPEPSANNIPHVAWTRGQRGGHDADPLTGHFFLGPPLPVDGRLYLLSEHDGQLYCTALSARSGQTLWQQSIALVDRSIDWDSARQMMACSPLAVGHVIVCPTEVGVVVGIDPLTGALRWICDHIDEDQRHTAGRWSSSSRRILGNTEFPSRMLSQSGRVFYLPFRSRFLHCIDATSGQVPWKMDRHDALALSAVTPELVILTGPREVSARSAENGSLLWKTTCPEPAGHGLVAGDQYLLPIRDGRCLALALSDGTMTGSRFGELLHELAQPTPESPAPVASPIHLVSHDHPAQPNQSSERYTGGNLLAANGFVVMAMPTSLAVFPQARPLLQTLTETADEGELAPVHRLEAAMLHLLLGEQPEAKRRLDRLRGTHSSKQIRHTALRLSREILFKELASAANPRPVLDQLSTIPAGDPDHLRLQNQPDRCRAENGRSGAVHRGCGRVLPHQY